MADKKHYIITSITLGAIAAVAAGLIGLANLITKDRIVQNEKEKIKSGISEIFGKCQVGSEGDLSEFKYTLHYYEVKNEQSEKIGYAFRTSGSNMYGKISLIVGFDEATHGFMGMYVVTDEQTYASTLEENYITPVNEDTRALEDVSCGATFGAKLVRDMVNDAKSAADSMWDK